MAKDTGKRLTHEEIKAKVLEGMLRASKKLVEQKKKEDSYFVFWENGKVVKVKARDIEI